MSRFFRVAMKNAVNDTTRVLAGAAIAIGLEVAGDITYQFFNPKALPHKKTSDVPAVCPAKNI